MSRVQALLPPRVYYRDDVRTWPGKSLGYFSVLNTYALLDSCSALESMEIDLENGVEIISPGKNS